jgi:hypothetical protein
VGDNVMFKDEKQGQKHEEGNVFMPMYDGPTDEERQNVQKIIKQVSERNKKHVKIKGVNAFGSVPFSYYVPKKFYDQQKENNPKITDSDIVEQYNKYKQLGRSH